MSRICSIDPGKSGGLAILESNKILSLIPTPTNEDGEVDFGEVAKHLEYWHPKFVVIELVHAMPRQGVTSCFNFGFSTGGLHGVCAALNLQVITVTPQKWQKSLMGKTKGVTHTKEMTIEFCKSIYPDVNFLKNSRCRTPHDGMADALAIGIWAQREEDKLNVK